VRIGLRLLLSRIGIAVLSVSATLLLLEIGIRVANPQDLKYWDSSPFRRIESTSPHFVENIPNSRANFIGVPVTINRYGLRGDDISIPKPAHTVRVLVVGDSVTFGYGIPLENTYAKVLEKNLNNNRADGIRYEVLNAGTLGGSLGDYLHFLTQRAEFLQPDIVVVGLNLNDVLIYSESGGVSGTGAEWQGGRPRLLHRLSQFALRHSQLYFFCYSSLKSWLYGAGVLDINRVQGSNFVALAAPSKYQAEAWQSTLSMLLRIATFCRGHSYRFVVVVFPMQMQMTAADFKFYRGRYHMNLGDAALSGEPQQRLQKFALANGVNVIDLLPVYRTYNSGEMYLRNKMIRSDPNHPSIKGNQVAADVISHALQAYRIVQE
jgi:hypothetical protein